MHEWFSNLKIRSKITLGFTFILMIFFIYALFSLTTSVQLVNKQKLYNLSAEAIEKIRKMQLHEMNFRITKHRKYIDDHRLEIDDLKYVFNKINNNEKDKNINRIINSLNLTIKEYTSHLEKLLILYEQKGLSYDKGYNHGLIGKLNSYYEDMYEILKGTEYENMILSLKINEKKFIDNSSEKNYKGVIGNIKTIDQQTNNLIYYETLSPLIIRYTNRFKTLYQIEKSIIIEEENIKKYQEQLEPSIVEYTVFIDKYIKNIQNRSIITSILLIIILIALIIFSSLFITIEITNSIRQITKTTVNIKDISKSLSVIVEKKAHTSMKAFSSIEQMKKLLDDQTRVIDKSSMSISLMTQNIHMITNLAQGKRESMKMMRRNINTAKDQIETLSQDINAIELNSTNMKKIVDIIHSISEKTKILSVNAGIEAANAGEFGNVLRVVARDIKELSFKVNNSAKEIMSYINKNEKVIKIAKTKSDEIINDFFEISTEVNKTTKSTVEIIDKISKINSDTYDIKSQLENLNSVNTLVTQTSVEMHDISNNIYSDINNLVDIKTETNKAISDIVNSINKISEEKHYLLDNLNFIKKKNKENIII